MERLAIITISIGNRPWSNYTIPSMEHYAGVCGADFFVERFPPLREELPLPELAPSPGRRNKIAYAAKSFFPWKYIELYGYDRVLVLDDTCCIRRNAESIFDLVPRGYCGDQENFAPPCPSIFSVYRFPGRSWNAQGGGIQ